MTALNLKKIQDIPVNSVVLIWAREALALSRSVAAERSGIALKRLAQLENSEKQPTLDELRLLSKTYRRTIATLLLSRPPKEKPLPIDRRTVDSKFIGNFHEKTILAIRKARALSMSLMELKNEAGLSIPKLQLRATIDDNFRKIARWVREFLQLHEVREFDNINLALDTYIEKVESLGIAVFQLSLTQDGVRGFSIVDEAIPIIGIKRGGESTTAKIFTLFHELGHILLNAGGICDLSENTTQDIEKWCNGFAAEVLIPTAELLKQDIVKAQSLKGEKIWPRQDLIHLGQIFHVGPLAILRTLLENSLTTSEFYKMKHEAWNKPSFGRSKTPEGRNVAKETIKEKGRTYISLAFKAFDQNRIDLKDLSDYLGVKLSYIPRTRQLLSA